MARNSEKAMSTLSRWRKLQEDRHENKKRPYLASLCSDLKEAEKWRKEILQEINNLVLLIQNSELGECKIRDMNDQINKLIREKRHWEKRILELGGHNYLKTTDNHSEFGSRSYKYFGAAKDLPGVRELFAQPEKNATKRTKAEIMKCIDCDYFGFRDEDDGIIVPLEEKAERIAREIAIKEI